MHKLTTAITTFLPLSNLIFALKLVDRVSKRTKKVSPKSEMLLFVVALIVTQKWLNDKPFANTCWVNLLNLNVRHINLIEREFLECLDYDLYVSKGEYESWFNYVQYHGRLWMTILHAQLLLPLQLKTFNFSK